jgi:hypothetical protein
MVIPPLLNRLIAAIPFRRQVRDSLDGARRAGKKPAVLPSRAHAQVITRVGAVTIFGAA